MSICIHCPEGHLVLVAASKLGGEVVCPRCLAPFLADANHETARNARAEKGKSRRSRDDDDDEEDDDEDEKPRKKAKPSKAKKVADDDEKPRKKAKSGKAKKENDDEDEEEEDEKPGKGKKSKSADDEEEAEPEEEEEPIEWTPRKRQLKICSFGLMVQMIACHLLAACAVFSLLAIIYYEMLEDFTKDTWKNGLAFYLFYYAAVPFIYLATAAVMTSMVISFAVPAKAEAKAGILSALVFGGLVFFLAFLFILSWSGGLGADARVQENMIRLLAGGSMFSFALCFVSAMGYMSKLLNFMKMQLEASQPITNGAFVLLALIGLLILTLVSSTAKESIGTWMSWVILAAAVGCSGFAIYMLLMHIKLIQKLRGAIQTYIRDA